MCNRPLTLTVGRPAASAFALSAASLAFLASSSSFFSRAVTSGTAVGFAFFGGGAGGGQGLILERRHGLEFGFDGLQTGLGLLQALEQGFIREFGRGDRFLAVGTGGECRAPRGAACATTCSRSFVMSPSSVTVNRTGDVASFPVECYPQVSSTPVNRGIMKNREAWGFRCHVPMPGRWVMACLPGIWESPGNPALTQRRVLLSFWWEVRERISDARELRARSNSNE